MVWYECNNLEGLLRINGEKSTKLVSDVYGRCLFPQVLAEVTASATAAEKVKLAVQKVKDKAQHIVDEINYEKSIAEEKLEAAKPALMEAERALQVNSWFRD